MAKKHDLKRNVLIGAGLVITILVLGFVFFKKPNQELFQAPGRAWNSPKKVEDYFVETLHMPPEEAKEIRSRGKGNDGTVDLRIGENTTLQGVVGNLAYYGFIRDEQSFRYALEHTKDTTPSTNAISVGVGSIDRNAEYRISEDMSAWEIADTLLNKPVGHFAYDEYRYFFMP